MIERKQDRHPSQALELVDLLDMRAQIAAKGEDRRRDQPGNPLPADDLTIQKQHPRASQDSVEQDTDFDGHGGAEWGG